MFWVDGLECGYYDRPTLAGHVSGQLAAVTVTIAFWEDTLESMDAIVKWHELARQNSDLVVIARSGRDIIEAGEAGKTAIVLGAQNSTPINDRIGFVELLHDMGLLVMQLTYNTQNAIGGSCYDQNDNGLTRFGGNVIREMNRVGMLIDLSHVGERTGRDAIAASEVPVAVTHANPRSLYEHPRNKSDRLLKELTEAGGMLGLAAYNNISGPYGESLATWCEMVARAVELIGIDSVGIGTDLSQNAPPSHRVWMRKGRWTQDEGVGATLPGVTPPDLWLKSTTQFPAVAEGLATAGFSADEVDKIMGKNWLRLYERVFAGN
jgi:membrane dipeptidase